MTNYHDQMKEQVEIILAAIDKMNEIKESFKEDSDNSNYPKEIRPAVRNTLEALEPKYNDRWLGDIANQMARSDYKTKGWQRFNWLSWIKKYDDWRNAHP